MIQAPCTKDCPRRSINPNCHNADICPEWGEYEKAKANEHRVARKAKDALGVYYDYAKQECIKKTKLTKTRHPSIRQY